jgi:hypothetical protein
MEEVTEKGKTYEQYFTKPVKFVLRNLKRLGGETGRFKMKMLNEATGKAVYSDTATGEDINVAILPATNGCTLSVEASSQQQADDFFEALAKAVNEDPTKALVIGLSVIVAIVLAVVIFFVVGQVQAHNHQQEVEDQFSCILNGGSMTDCD